jgi:RNA polymerase sigma-70 factor (ECF subfamily)
LAATEQIFQQLFTKEYSGLCRYALTFMQDEHAAEDVVQDTFIRIWEGKRELITSPDIRFYLVTAVRNNCISALRKAKTSVIQFPEHTPEGDPEPFFSPTQSREEAAERQRRLSAALDTLPAKCREVFLLVKMQGLSYKQAADTLGISVKTVEAQMGKALRTLRETTVLALVLIMFLSSPIVKLIGDVGVKLIRNVLS